MHPMKKLRTKFGSVAIINNVSQSDGFVSPQHNSGVEAPRTGKRKLDNVRPTDQQLPIVDRVITTNLQDLNDACLFKILDLKHLSILDLCSITQSCIRLKEISSRIFERKYKICNFLNMAVDDTSEARRVFQTFGSLIFELEIDFSNYSHSNSTCIMDAVLENCTSLESLSLYRYHIPDEQHSIDGMGNFFRKLKKLHLNDVMIYGNHIWPQIIDGVVTVNGNLIKIFTNCESLIDLKVKGSFDLDRVVLSSTFPSLQYFEYKGWTYSRIASFTLRHSNLRSIIIECEDEMFDHIPVLKAVENCKVLERLRYGFKKAPNLRYVKGDASLKSLKKLKHLRELKIFRVADYSMQLIKELPLLFLNLEVLELDQVENASGLMSVVSLQKRLRIFKLCRSKKVDNINMIGELKHLTELALMDVEAYPFDLVQIVSRSENLKTLTLAVNEFEISEQMYRRLVDIVSGRFEARNRSLSIWLISGYYANDCVQSSATVNVVNSQSLVG